MTPLGGCSRPLSSNDASWSLFTPLEGPMTPLACGGAPMTPFEGLFTPFDVLEDVCLIWEVSRANEVSHVDWKTQVGAQFVSGLGLIQAL